VRQLHSTSHLHFPFAPGAGFFAPSPLRRISKDAFPGMPLRDHPQAPTFHPPRRRTLLPRLIAKPLATFGDLSRRRCREPSIPYTQRTLYYKVIRGLGTRQRLPRFHAGLDSTPSDLVRFALATNADSVNGELAGGSVMSLMTRRDNGIVVAVASNIAHANTAALALKVADTFAEQK